MGLVYSNEPMTLETWELLLSIACMCLVYWTSLSSMCEQHTAQRTQFNLLQLQH